LQLLSATNGDVLESRDAKGGLLRDITVFQDESRFVTALSDGTVGVWDIDSFNLIASLPTKHSLECISVSRDGYRLAIGGGSATIEVMDGMSRGSRVKNATSKKRD
jgi:WD40 repeat protein